MGTTKDNFDFRALVHEASRYGFRYWSRACRFLGVARRDREIAASQWPRVRGGRCCTAIRPMADTASIPVWRTPPISGGNWLRCCEELGPELLDTYDEERRPVFISTARDFIEKAIESDRDFLAAYDPVTDKAAFAIRVAGACVRCSVGGAFVRAELRGSPIVTRANSRAPSAY